MIKVAEADSALETVNIYTDKIKAPVNHLH